jgi:hypothetical protein
MERAHPPLRQQNFRDVLASSQQICTEERQSESYYVYGQLLIFKKCRFVFICVVAFCLFSFVLFACLLVCLLAYLLNVPWDQ